MIADLPLYLCSPIKATYELSFLSSFVKIKVINEISHQVHAGRLRKPGSWCLLPSREHGTVLSIVDEGHELQ